MLFCPCSTSLAHALPPPLPRSCVVLRGLRKRRLWCYLECLLHCVRVRLFFFHRCLCVHPLRPRLPRARCCFHHVLAVCHLLRGGVRAVDSLLFVHQVRGGLVGARKRNHVHLADELRPRHIPCRWRHKRYGLR